MISIIVPCYNQSEYLDDALNSVRNQTFIDWECIIVNDGSTDTTEIVSKKWLALDSRFKYIYQKNAGLSAARNVGIENANGKFILPLDADDKISEKYIELAIKAFENDISLKLVYCNAEKFGVENGIWHLEPFTLKLLAKRNIIFCSALFKKQDWKLVNGFDESLIYGFEDWEFWIALLKNGGNVKKIEYTGFFYRTKQSSMVKRLVLERKQKMIEIINKKHIDFFINQLGNFTQLSQIIENKNADLENKKFVIDLFLKTFFKFKIFNK